MPEKDWESIYRGLGLSEEEISQVQEFIKLVNELDDRMFFQRQRSIGVYLEADRDKVEGVSDHGDIEDFRSAMLSLRKLISDDEPSFVNRVVGHILRNEDNLQRKEDLDKRYKEIKRARKKPAEASGTLNLNGCISLAAGRTQEDALKDLFNSQLFHSDTKSKSSLPEARGSELPDNDINMMLLRQTHFQHFAAEFPDFSAVTD